MIRDLKNPKGIWVPPIHFYKAGRQKISSDAYSNDKSKDTGMPRILIKHTISGRGKIDIEGVSHELVKGSMFIIEVPGPYCYYYDGSDEPWCFEYITIAHHYAQGILPDALRSNPILDMVKHSEITNELESLINHWLETEREVSLNDSAWAYRFILSCVNIVMERDVSREPSYNLKKMILKSAGKCSIGECAKKIGYTQPAITRLFSKTYGISPGRFSLLVKLRRACRGLEQGENLKTIAWQCGFVDATHFGRSFKSVLGVSPGQYRKNHDPIHTPFDLLEQ